MKRSAAIRTSRGWKRAHLPALIESTRAQPVAGRCPSCSLRRPQGSHTTEPSACSTGKAAFGLGK
ncbi:hypothetical protein D3C85_1856630 [compost metagenome]